MQSPALDAFVGAMSVLLLSSLAGAQDATSRLIPFSLVTTLPPSTTQDVVVELWDAATGGVLIFPETYTALPVDGSRSISFRFGSQQVPPGLDPIHFPSGSARYLDVTQAGASVLSARLPLTAVAFALSPGPDGPPGPQGPPGPSDVPENLTMVDSTATAGNLIKGGVLFLHNTRGGTFLGKNAGNLTMEGFGTNAAIGVEALRFNTNGNGNTPSGTAALYFNTTGANNTAIGYQTLFSNASGHNNTVIGAAANVSATNLTNATVIGAGAVVNASNKVRVGNAAVTVIEGEVGFTASSDRNKKENLNPSTEKRCSAKSEG